MIAKAVFWLGVLVLLTPHEPDIGLDRPSATFPGTGSANDVHVAPQKSEYLAATVPSAILALREDFLQRVPQIRADIRDSLGRQKRKNPGAAGAPLPQNLGPVHDFDARQ